MAEAVRCTGGEKAVEVGDAHTHLFPVVSNNALCQSRATSELVSITFVHYNDLWNGK